MSNFLYLRGNPGVGKITVARLLEEDLGWRVFWLHDLKNAVYMIVKTHRIPRLMDAVTTPVISHLLEQGADVIYVRPSPDRQTVEQVQQLVLQTPGYTFWPVQLTASRDTLVERVNQRDDPFRISNTADLDTYLQERPPAAIDGELVINTDSLTPQQTAEAIKRQLGL